MGVQKIEYFLGYEGIVIFWGHHITRLYMEAIPYGSIEGTCGKIILSHSHNIIISFPQHNISFP